MTTGDLPFHRRTLLRAAACAGLLAVAGCTGPRTPQPEGMVKRFASANPGSVNTFWFPTRTGLVVVDAQRSLTDARAAVARIRRTGRPVRALLITHPHPDHVGGIGVLHEAFPQAPVYASAATAEFIRTDPLGFYRLTRSLPGADYPQRMTLPDHVVAPNATLEIDGTRFETAEFGPGESSTATVYYEPASRSLFAGDLVAGRATVAMLEGHTCGWLTNLDGLRTRFREASLLYPGHGAPGAVTELIEAQTQYLRRFRGLVRGALPPGSATVDDAGRRAVLAAMDRTYPGYQPVASLPTLPQENVRAVAAELAAERPGSCPR